MKPKQDEHQFPLTAQQVKALNLSVFGSFPYVATRLVPALYHLSLLPVSFERKRPSCTVLLSVHESVKWALR